MNPAHEVVRFFQLPPDRRRIAAKAAAALVLLGLGLKFLSFSIVRRLFKRASATRCDSGEWSWTDVGRVMWAVDAAAARIPIFDTCLCRALVAALLLEMQAIPCALRLGVAKDRSGKLTAHAWLEVEEKVALGGSEALLSQFTPLQVRDLLHVHGPPEFFRVR